MSVAAAEGETFEDFAYDSDIMEEEGYDNDDYEYDSMDFQEAPEDGDSTASSSSGGASWDAGGASPFDGDFEILSPEDLVRRMAKDIDVIASITQMSPTSVRVLLQHFKWDKDKLMERFYLDDSDKVLAEAGVVVPKQKEEAPSSFDSATVCLICFTELESSEMAGLECGHRYCHDCWSGYLTTSIVDEGKSQTIQCPDPECKNLVDDETVMRLVGDGSVRTKYQSLISRSYVQFNRFLNWCSAPNCTFVVAAVQTASYRSGPVNCRCGHLFCFGCSEDWHEPVTCHMLKRWHKKCVDDSETCNWIAANTKDCPKCHATIEKNGGCNHMSCRECHADFCWVCLVDWGKHTNGYYNCNSYNEENNKDGNSKVDKSRAALNRYLFYFTRFTNHQQSLKLEHKLEDKVEEKMEGMQQLDMSWIEVQFLRKAVDTLRQCRRTLMYTYVFAFYMEKNNQSELFEDNQKDLETATEVLSEYLERDIGSDLDGEEKEEEEEVDLAEMKRKVQDKTRYCDKRRRVLLDHVREGFEKEWWELKKDV